MNINLCLGKFLIVTGQKTLNTVYVPACKHRILKNRKNNIIFTVRDGDVFFFIKSDTKPEDIPGLIKGRRKHPDRELHIIIFVNEKGELILDGKPADPQFLETIIQADTKKDVQQLFCQEEGEGKGKKTSPKKKKELVPREKNIIMVF